MNNVNKLNAAIKEMKCHEILDVDRKIINNKIIFQIILGESMKKEDKLEQLILRIEKKMDERFESIEKRLYVIEKRLDNVEKRLDNVEKRLDVVEKRLDVIENRLDNVEKRLDVVEKRLDIIENKIDLLIDAVVELQCEAKRHGWNITKDISGLKAN